MPKLGMEALCLMITCFLIILFFNNSKLDRRSRTQVIYARLLFVSFAVILAQALVVAGSHFSDYVPRILIEILLGVFLVLLLCDLFVIFLYTRYIINLDLPDMKKIGGWTSYGIGIVLIMAVAVPAFSFWSSKNSNAMAFNDGIPIILVFMIIYELIIGAMFFINRKYLNPKRKTIIFLGFISQLCCFMFQYRHQNMMFFSLGIAIVVLSFYMTLENEDVKLIDQLNSEKEKADKANAAKSNFIANVSHEIRTPINAVLGMDEMILRETKEEMTRQYAYDIKSATQTLHGIINEILDMSKMESGKMEIIPVNYNLRNLLNDTTNMIQFKADDKNLEFRIEVDPAIPIGYVGDEIRIKQILTNVLTNAVKYTEKGGVVLRVSASYGPDDNTRMLRFEVEDTGIGMKKEDLDNISKAYMRFESEKNRNVEGTGLGMTITMQLLDMMDSKLNIESEYGRGTKVSFNILQPVWDDNFLGDINTDKSFANYGEYEYEKSFEAPHSKVLVVDDNAVNRKVFKGLLKETGLLIDEADSGDACLAMVRRNKYDIVFMDHMMPNMDGIETFRKMKEMEGNQSKGAPVIMLTANAVGGAKELYLSEGFDDFSAKPIVPEELEKMIRRYLKL